MEHFDITRWTDYVRGLIPATERKAMERHIAEGCRDCAHLMALVGRIYEESTAEAMVPEAMVAAAKSIFPARRAAESADWLTLPKLAARMIFDNLSGLALEGARSASEAAVQAVYHAGDYAIELQIEREPESTEMALVGQLVDRAGSGKPLSGAAVALMVRDKVMTRVESNAFGEFCLTAKAQPGLKLCVAITEIGRRVEIPLTRILAGRR